MSMRRDDLAHAARRPYRAASCSDGLPLAQRSLDGGVEAVQTHAEQLGGAIVAGQQVAVEALHQRPDELEVLAGDRRGDAAGHRREVEAAGAAPGADEHRVARCARSISP